MWVFTTEGFFSAVINPADPDEFQVRTRAYDDAKFLCDWALAEHGVELQVMTKKLSDYPWRVFMSRELWGSYLVYAAETADYTNFKDRVAEVNKERALVYAGVWQRMLAVEDEDRPITPRPTYPSFDALLGLELDEWDEGARARSIHDLTEQEWQELMEEAPAPAPAPRKRNRRRRGSRR